MPQHGNFTFFTPYEIRQDVITSTIETLTPTLESYYEIPTKGTSKHNLTPFPATSFLQTVTGMSVTRTTPLFTSPISAPPTSEQKAMYAQPLIRDMKPSASDLSTIIELSDLENDTQYVEGWAQMRVNHT